MLLTLEDPRAQIKGSRDPLGVQSLWTRFGRHLVGNLTTVTNSVRNFRVLLLGRYLGARAVEEGMASEDDALSMFLRWEQVAAYVRHVVHAEEGDIRGIERVKRRVAGSEGAVPIGVEAEQTILSDQRTYGLWGLFTVAARVSGMLPDGILDVAAEAREFVERTYVPLVGRTMDAVLNLMVDGGDLSTSEKHPLVAAVGRALVPTFTADERLFFGHWLRDRAGVDGRLDLGTQPGAGSQRRLSALMAAETDLATWIGRDTVAALAKAAAPNDEGLARRLHRALALEAVIAPMECVFEQMIARRNATTKDLAAYLRKAWGASTPNVSEVEYREIQPEIEDVVGADLGTVVGRASESLRRGEYPSLIEDLVVWNDMVMRGRGSGAWVTIQGGRVDVRYAGPEVVLPQRDELPALWRNSYFLDSLREITRQLAVEGS